MMYRSIFILSLILFSFLRVNAQVSDKFLENTAKTVWAMEIPEFNPSTPIPDSLAANNSAVVIARYYGLNGDYDNQFNPTKQRTYGISANNATKFTYLRRSMVKLLDQTAVDEFSDFEFGEETIVKKRHHELASARNAFGARVYKPDGSMHEVDLSQALKVAHGKKENKDESLKIPIPGLEIGDVIDYFYCDEITIDEMSLPSFDVYVIKEHPALNVIIDGSFDKNLTVEYRSINGLPDLVCKSYSETSNNRNEISLRLTDVQGNPGSYFSRIARQSPCLRMAVHNNNTQFIPKPSSSRAPGFCSVIPVEMVYADCQSMLLGELNKLKENSGVYGKAKKLTRDFAKKHPEATNRQVIDAAYIAMVYSMLTEKDDGPSDQRLAMLLNKLVNELKLSDRTSIALLASRSQPVITDIIDWKDPYYASIIGDSLYCFKSFGTYMPGETPASYQGETALAIKWPIAVNRAEQYFVNLNNNMAKDNQYSCEMKITIDPESQSLHSQFDATATGAMKHNLMLPITVKGLISYYADFLGTTPPSANPADLVVLQSDMDKAMAENSSRMHGIEITDVSDSKIMDYGLLPGSKGIVLSHKGVIKNEVVDTGDDLILNVGHLLGKRSQISEKERSRTLPAFLPSTQLSKYKITIATPEGYTPDPASLEHLTINESSALGKVYAYASIDDDNNVVVGFIEQYNTFFISPDQWPEFLRLDNLATSVYDASIIYNKVSQ